MRVQISITDDEGRVFEGEAELSLLGHGSGKPVSGRERSRKSHETKSGSLQTPVFSLNPRAFMKRYARGRSGPQKFHSAAGVSGQRGFVERDYVSEDTGPVAQDDKRNWQVQPIPFDSRQRQWLG